MDTENNEYKDFIFNPQTDDEIEKYRTLALNDLYFLLRFVLDRPELDNDFVRSKCKDVQENPYGIINVWARGHYSSAINTFALAISRIVSASISGEKVKIAFVSSFREIWESFADAVACEIKGNVVLNTLFPELKDSEHEICSFGIFDDVKGLDFTDIFIDGVSSFSDGASPDSDLISKAVDSIKDIINEYNKSNIVLVINRYKEDDVCTRLCAENILPKRLVPAVKDGEPQLMTQEELDSMKNEIGEDSFKIQMLLEEKEPEVSRDKPKSRKKNAG